MVFIGIALIFNGSARIVEGLSLIGAVFVGLIVAIGLLITGIQMIAVGASGRKIMPDSS